MPLQIVGPASQPLPFTGTNASTINVPNPAHSAHGGPGVTAGDLIIIYITTRQGGDSVTCSGFSRYSQPAGGGTTGTLLTTTATGAEGDRFTAFSAGSTTSYGGMVVVIRGGVFDAIGTPKGTASQVTSMGVTAITLSATGGWLLWLLADYDWFNGYPITSPAGFTTLASIGASSTGPNVQLAYKTGVSSGSTGTQTGTSASAAYINGVMLGVGIAEVDASVLGINASVDVSAFGGRIDKAYSASPATITASAKTGLAGPSAPGIAATVSVAALQGSVQSTAVTMAGLQAATVAAAPPGVLHADCAVFGPGFSAATPTKQNTAEGGIDNATPTPGNTGGDSGDAFDGVSSPAAITFSASDSHTGAMSYRVTPFSGSAFPGLQWNVTTTDLYVLTWFKFDQVPASVFLSFYTGTNNQSVQTDSTGHLVAACDGATSVTGSFSMAAGTWHAVESHFHQSTGSAYTEARIKNDNGDVLDFVATAKTGTASGSTSLMIQNAGGQIGNNYFMDDLAYSTTGWLTGAVVNLAATSTLKALIGGIGIGQPTWINPWYSNLINPRSSDFEAPDIP